MVSQGCALREFAAALDISPKTVEFHTYRLRAQLRVRSTAELIAVALRHDLVSRKPASGEGESPSTRKTPHHHS